MDLGNTNSNFGDTEKIREIRREGDSVDDFEHLGHDVSPLVEIPRPLLDAGKIDKVVENTSATVGDGANQLGLFDTKKAEAVSPKMDTNLLDLVDTIPDRKEADAKLDKFLSEFTTPSEKHLKEAVKETTDSIKESMMDDFKSASQNFMDMERGSLSTNSQNNFQPHETTVDDLMERFSDSDPEDDFKLTKEDIAKSNDHIKGDLFKDLDDFELPKTIQNPIETEKTQKIEKIEKIVESKSKTPEPELDLISSKSDTIKLDKSISNDKMISIDREISTPILPKESEQSIIEKDEPIILSKSVEDVVEVLKPVEKESKSEEKIDKIEKPEKTVIQAEAMFCKMGLDAWFIPEKLNPRVADLVYWRDPKKSGPVFGGVLVVLLALTYFSLISVIAYLSLLGLTGTISFRVYKNIIQAVQKTGDGHPFKEFLDTDLSLPQEKVEEISKVAVAHFNAAMVELRRLFLVEDLVDSIKFGVLLWCLTYLGHWFNGMTLIIIAWVALFTLPKVYETNKAQIDANIDIVRNKLEDITSKVKAAIPIGKKPEEKKQQ